MPTDVNSVIVNVSELPTLTAEQLDEAVTFAINAHRNQRDWCNDPYVSHPVRVMLHYLRTYGLDEGALVAVLHDTIEDTVIKYGDIRERFGQVVADGVQAMTKHEGQNYKSDYLPQVKHNVFARRVKLLDMADNLTRNACGKNIDWLFRKYDYARSYLEFKDDVSDRIEVVRIDGQTYPEECCG